MDDTKNQLDLANFDLIPKYVKYSHKSRTAEWKEENNERVQISKEDRRKEFGEPPLPTNLHSSQQYMAEAN